MILLSGLKEKYGREDVQSSSIQMKYEIYIKSFELCGTRLFLLSKSVESICFRHFEGIVKRIAEWEKKRIMRRKKLKQIKSVIKNKIGWKQSK